ncbi:succinate dehydrogenase, hydrophobic membrane anchor protein [Ciceribacter sp. L1K23]|uniref:succinate dehydrogenase, hydrophobic membrane anchor protein n=1 Tax=Ciceribacter sp. L1K23 TaxID=2820276 RepID=UPI001B817281|nr:succinate dehydrogenase, hydrophobic membrane anchor protein [Ciceribacter sp. L1K23]MBR0557048.1 succinate dehydrogenase, hydrophobic membrane anchor protein [Ciceribacter sp. L1K23]
MKTALGRVLGLGSAKSGTDEFVKDRIRSVFLLALTPYMVGVGVWLAGRPYADVVTGLSSPFVSLPLGLFIIMGILHMRLGMQTIIEDYIHGAGWKFALTILNTAFCVGLGVATLFAVLRLALGLAPTV